MKNKKARVYNSIVRQKQAEETKKRIADAAEELIKSHGYEQATISAIAQLAGVATQTVYAVFSSKQGILIHILSRSLADIKMDADFKLVMQNGTVSGVAKRVAEVAARYGQKQLSTVNALGGFEVLYPELYSLMKEASMSRRASLKTGIDAALAARGIKLAAAKKKTLTDIIWAFTDSHLYYYLVVEAGWPIFKFEKFFHKIMETVMDDLAPDMLKEQREPGPAAKPRR